VFIESGRGCFVRDVDGNDYVDYVCSWGPLLFGHAPGFVVNALAEVAPRGTSFGAPTELEVELAELVARLVPGIDLLRCVNSGSEATASAIRLARGATGRPVIVKCAGCYHGSVDSLLVTAGSGVATLGIPETSGVPEATARDTVVVEFNDVDALEQAFAIHGGRIAAVILEPIAGNMGLVPPAADYLRVVRDATARNGALLIFDEVMTGFRVAPDGAQGLFSVRPDLTCFGKIIGGGLPVGAYGGRRDIMEQLAPLGPVYQAGTLAGNPLAMSAGIAMLREIERRGAALYTQLETAGARLEAGLRDVFEGAGQPVCIQRAGSMMTLFFDAGPVRNYAEAKRSDVARFAAFFHAMLDRGVFLPPSQFECWFLSAAHDDAAIGKTISAARDAAAVAS
jgi:glutamate-1-semialdehyde 2,1-aminomutase